MNKLLFLLVFLVSLPVGADPGPAARFARIKADANAAVGRLGTNLTVHWPADRARPSMVRGLRVAVKGDTAGQRALAFVQRYPALFAGNAARFAVGRVQSTRDITAVRLKQLYRGVEVLDAGATVSMDRRGRVVAVHSDGAQVGAALSPTPRVTATRAIALAVEALAQRFGVPSSASLPAGLTPKLAVLPGAQPRLVYRVMLPLTHDPGGRIHLVDAHDGTYRGWRRGMIARPHGPTGQVRR